MSSIHFFIILVAISIPITVLLYHLCEWSNEYGSEEDVERFHKHFKREQK